MLGGDNQHVNMIKMSHALYKNVMMELFICTIRIHLKLKKHTPLF